MGRYDSQRRSYRYTGNNLKSRKRQKGMSWIKWSTLIIALGLLTFIGYNAYELFYKPVGRNSEVVYLTVNREKSLEKLREDIQTKLWPRHPKLLDYLIEYEDLASKLSPGRYAITPEMSTMELVKTLRDGIKTPVQLSFQDVRTEDELIKHLTSRLLMDQAELRSALFDAKRLERLQLDSQSVRSLFLVQSYEVPWEIEGKEFMDMMEQRYEQFWTDSRKAKLDSLGITAAQATSLAAILEEESSKKDEHPQIARLYLNRYHINMPLQSDPTVKFALGDFSLRRILSEHLKVDSPYNTYRTVGITPGPIRLVRPETIDAVLNAPKHKYLYMCAKEDFSGYHNFAADYATHLKNARAYQKALNARGIK